MTASTGRMSEQREALAEVRTLDAVADMLREAIGADDWFAISLATRLLIVRHVARLLADAEQRGADRVAAADMLAPWGPFEMSGFEGCTDVDPSHCACATDAQPTCRICEREIEQGELAWARQWPCYDTLPLDHKDQEWDVISWHDECPPSELRAALGFGAADRVRADVCVCDGVPGPHPQGGGDCYYPSDDQ